MSTVLKDCKSCPSFCDRTAVRSIFRTETGCDVCKSFGHFLSKPGDTAEADERVRIQFASKCEHHGELAPEHLPNVLAALVAIGDPMIARERALRVAPVDTADRPVSCTGCRFFVPADIVRQELGWLLPACASKGRLLFPTKLSTEALACSDGEKGGNRDTTDGMILLPEYSQTTTSVRMPTSAKGIESLTPAIDGRDYETDKPVSPKFQAQHIRAWRAIPDPEGLHDDVFWPIFDWKAAGYDDPRLTYENHDAELYLDHDGIMYDLVVELMKHESVPSLIGPAGSGKTVAAAVLARMGDWPLTVHSMRDDAEVYEYIGETALEATGTGSISRFIKGYFIEDLETAGVSLIDEINLAPEPIMHFFRPIFLGAKHIMIPQGKITINKHPWRFLMTAMNPSWDMRYIGTKPLAAPDFERMQKIAVDIPPPNIEREIILSHCRAAGYDLPISTLDKIMQIAIDLREYSKNGEIPVAWGIRPQIAVALRTATYSLMKAYKRVATDGFEEGVAALVLKSVETIA